MNKKNIYETDNLALCPYLAMNDLKFLGIRKDMTGKKFFFMFEDEKYQGSDLAMSFLKSSERQYKNHWSFFRNELAKAQKNQVEVLIQLEPLLK